MFRSCALSCVVARDPEAISLRRSPLFLCRQTGLCIALANSKVRTHSVHLPITQLHRSTVMRVTGSSKSSSAHDTTAVRTKPAGWRLVNRAHTSTQTQDLTTQDLTTQDLATQQSSTPGWSAVQQDFENRLSRFGISISETKTPSVPSNDSTVQIRGGAHVIMDGYTRDAALRNTHLPEDEDFPTLKAPTLSVFTNKRESSIESLEKQLRQARVEVQIWKEKCEAQERDLRTSFGETMKWRMEYENLYSAVIRDQEIQPPKAPAKRHGTKSLG